mmetsp:Transcript_50105/g.162199  ORF Transcript_50105/g.162199 Transcript_50105/m.162199 type:complete len:210 (+) Transcript_50105:358-987(+)
MSSSAPAPDAAGVRAEGSSDFGRLRGLGSSNSCCCCGSKGPTSGVSFDRNPQRAPGKAQHHHSSIFMHGAPLTAPLPIESGEVHQELRGPLPGSGPGPLTATVQSDAHGLLLSWKARPKALGAQYQQSVLFPIQSMRVDVELQTNGAAILLARGVPSEAAAARIGFYRLPGVVHLREGDCRPLKAFVEVERLLLGLPGAAATAARAPAS